MIDPNIVIQVGGLVGSFLAAAYLGAKKISGEAQKTRSTVVKAVAGNQEFIETNFSTFSEGLAKDLETRLENNFNGFQRLHSTRYRELNEIVSEALENQALRNEFYKTEINALKEHQTVLETELKQLRNLIASGDIPIDDLPTVAFDVRQRQP